MTAPIRNFQLIVDVFISIFLIKYISGARLRDERYLATMDGALYLIPAWFYGHSILLIAPASEPRRPGLDKQGLKK